MLLWLLGVYSAITCWGSFCQALPTPEQQKLSCKINDDTETFFKDIPGVRPMAIVRSKTVSVIVDVADKIEKGVLLRVCEFPTPSGVQNNECHQLTVAYGNETYPSHNMTTTGQHLISLNLPDQLRSNPYVLQLAFNKDFENYAERRNDVGTNETFIECGVLVEENQRRKRQAESCQGFGDYIILPGIDEWCRLNCAVGYCPSTHCTCANQAWPAEEDDYGNEGDLHVQFLK